MQNTYSPIKAIVFDLGGVLVDIDFEKTITEYGKQTGLSVEEIKKSTFLTSVYQDYEAGYLNECQFRAEVCSRFGISLKPELFDYAWNALLLDFNPTAIELIKHLRQNFPVYLLSNTNKIHFEECNRRLHQEFNETFESLFTGLFLSYRIGYRKPSERIFQHVVSQTRCKPHEILFIDDLEENIQAANQMGFKTIHLTDNRQINHKTLEFIALHGVKTR